MRELSLTDTGCLAGLLLLSLVLPLMTSLRPTQNGAARRSSLKTVWLGQGLGVVAGVAVLASASLAPYAATLGLAGYLGCAFALFRRFRVA